MRRGLVQLCRAVGKEIHERVCEKAAAGELKLEHQVKIQKKVDLDSRVEGLENEFRSEISKALKRSEDKVLVLIAKAREMQKAATQQPTLRAEYNQLVKAAEKARWELMVHRQSVGFRLNSWELADKFYQIPQKL